jgi:hypothetical protein
MAAQALGRVKLPSVALENLQSSAARALSSLASQAQPVEIVPQDRPRLVWVNASTVNIIPPPGKTSMQFFLTNGKKVVFNGTMTWRISSGLDAGTEAASTWYYLYIRIDPQTGAISPIGSLNNSGPSGVPLYLYVGAVFNNATSDIDQFVQLNKDEFFWQAHKIIPGATIPTSGFHTNLSVALHPGFIPNTASAVWMYGVHNRSPGTGFGIWQEFKYPGQTTRLYGSFTTGLTNFAENAMSVFMPVPISGANAQRFVYNSFREGGTDNMNFQQVSVTGWLDYFLT